MATTKVKKSKARSKVTKVIICSNCGNRIIGKPLIDENNVRKYCSDCAGVCHNCEDVYENDALYHVHEIYELEDTVLVCENCEQDYTMCYKCEELYHDHDIVNVDGHYWCMGCVNNQNNHIVQCVDCNDYFNFENSGITVGDNQICSDCSDSYYCCDSCGDYYRDRDISHCSDCEQTFCSDCYDSSSHNCEHGDDSERDPVGMLEGTEKGKYITDPRMCGAEIETEGLSRSKFRVAELPDGVGAVDDGSLSDGKEIVTPPASLNKLEDVIKTTCKYLSDSGLRVSDHCGLHIHLDMREYKENPAKLSSVMQTYYTLEQLLFAMVPHARRTIIYCRSLRSNFKEDDFIPSKAEHVDEIYYKEEGVVFSKGNRYNGARYYWCNLHSVYYRGSLEIRLHSGTISAHKILSWMGLHQAIIAYAVSDGFDIDKIQEVMAIETNINRLEALGKLIKLPGQMVKYYQMRITKFN